MIIKMIKRLEVKIIYEVDMPDDSHENSVLIEHCVMSSAKAVADPARRGFLSCLTKETEKHKQFVVNNWMVKVKGYPDAFNMPDWYQIGNKTND